MMEVDGIENSSVTSMDAGKFANLKAFVNAAREFESTHSESAVNLMNRYLGLIASTCDLSLFSPGRSEVCAFFSSLWRVMCDGRGPHWAGIAVLSRACIEPSAKHALTHTYKFMPIMTRLLSSTVSNEKKIKLLSVMQEISYGIKISWQESYLTTLMKQLTDWITQPFTDPLVQLIGHKSLTVLVNVCYGNLPAVYALMRTVDTKNFVLHLISLKEGGYGGVEVCRLLLCLTSATRGAGAMHQDDVNSYLATTMHTFHKAVVDKEATPLLQASTFLSDLSKDSNLRSFVISYPHFTNDLKDSLTNLIDICQKTENDQETEQSTSCIQNALKFLTVLINLELYKVRKYHCQMLCLCMLAHRFCLAEALELFAAVILQYKDEGQLPKELITVIGGSLAGLLVPPELEPGKAGLQWLQVVGALCETDVTQEQVLLHVKPDSYEDTLYSVLQYTSQNGPMGLEQAHRAVVVGCGTALRLAPLCKEWQAALMRFLAHHQVRKILCTGISSGSGARRKDILQLLKHHGFPSDQMEQVFGSSPAGGAGGAGAGAGEAECPAAERGAWEEPRLAPQQELAVDALVAALDAALKENRISDIATSSVMELYGYKMTCLEQRLHSHHVALQGASEQMATLQHSLAMLQATNSSQQDVLYVTQTQNEKHKKTIENQNKLLEDAETVIRGLRAKIAAEKSSKEKQKELLQNEFRNQLLALENDMKAVEREAEGKLKKSEEENKALQKMLDQEAKKTSELSNVLIKLEEQMKMRGKDIEAAAAVEKSLRKDIENRDTTIKHLEKTVLERENRLYQLNTQLEEMKRVQEMVAKLMSRNASPNPS